jgi:hypothetical protein
MDKTLDERIVDLIEERSNILNAILRYNDKLKEVDAKLKPLYDELNKDGMYIVGVNEDGSFKKSMAPYFSGSMEKFITLPEIDPGSFKIGDKEFPDGF